jgi:S1-C subfamily serine protease
MKLAATALTMLTSATVLAETEAEAFVRMQRMAVSVMQVYASSGGMTRPGSAVAIGDHLAVTSCHVMGTADAAIASRGSAQTWGALHSGDTGRDLCVLRLESSVSFVPELGSSNSLKVGSPVIAVGFVMRRLMPGAGQVTALYRYKGAYVIRTNAPFTTGASGGALFDNEGRLVGILTVLHKGVRGAMYFAVPVEWALELSGTKQTLDRSRPAFWSPEQSPRPWFIDAAAYELDGEWGKLEKIAAQQMTADPSDEEARRALELARAHQRQAITSRF